MLLKNIKKESSDQLISQMTECFKQNFIFLNLKGKEKKMDNLKNFLSGRGMGRGSGQGSGSGGGGGQRRGSGGGGRGRGGRGGNRPNSGPGGNCICPSCGTKVPHKAGVPCYTVKCPNCGTQMMKE